MKSYALTHESSSCLLMITRRPSAVPAANISPYSHGAHAMQLTEDSRLSSRPDTMPVGYSPQYVPQLTAVGPHHHHHISSRGTSTKKRRTKAARQRPFSRPGARLSGHGRHPPRLALALARSISHPRAPRLTTNLTPIFPPAAYQVTSQYQADPNLSSCGVPGNLSIPS